MGALFGRIIGGESLDVLFKGNLDMELSKEEEFAFIVKNLRKLKNDHKKSLIHFPWLIRVHFPNFLTSLDAEKVKYNDAYTYEEYQRYFMRKYSVASEVNRMYLELIIPFWQLAKQNPYDKKLTEIDDKFCNSVVHLMIAYGICPMVYNINYAMRADTQRNYHNMVYLKYLIMKNKIQDNDIVEFLKSQGDSAIDPITQKTFVWNAEDRSLSLSNVHYKHLPTSIRKAMNEDGKSKTLQVKLSK